MQRNRKNLRSRTARALRSTGSGHSISPRRSVARPGVRGSRGRCGRQRGAEGFTGQGIYPGNSGAGGLQAALRFRAGHPAAHVLQEDRDADRNGAAGLGARRLRGPAQPLVRRSLPVRRRRLHVAEALRTRGRGRHAAPASRTSRRSPSWAKRSAPSGSRARRSPATGSSSTGRSSIRRTRASFPTRSRRTR